jgi:CPA1 family monovalent cation:H+ antiporter
VWKLVEYVLEGLVFLLIGQQLPDLLAGLRAYPATTVVAAGVVTVASVLLLRPFWLALSERLPARLHTRLAEDDDATDPHRHLESRDIVALSWAGTRGVITLAAAFSLPLTLDGRPFPARDLLLFCAYLVVFATLVGQGLTFGVVLRRLRYRSTGAAEARLRNEARVAAVRAALARLEDLIEEEDLPEAVTGPLREAASRRLDRYTHRVERLTTLGDEELPRDDAYYTAVRVRRELIAAERNELLHWRDTGRLTDPTMRALQRELDHEEGLLPL